MFWADKITTDLKGKQVINDSWTPSGRVHIGSLKGPILHDTIFRVLREKDSRTIFIFGIDDMDPIDGLPQELIKSHEKYFGFPLFLAPSPDGNGSFADYFTRQLIESFEKLNIKGEIYRVEKLYKEGKFNEWIKKSLDNAGAIRKIYKEVSGSQRSDDWYPFQVICPKCNKIGTTKVDGWDGKEVSFSCLENLVSWAKGCGFKGKISPFDGKGKLVWRVEWASKWALFGVTIEAAGKDHASRGGSYDVSGKICEDIFGKKIPLKIPYEHFLSGGKKMSSSKGVGLSANELLSVMPPELVRFLMIKTSPNVAVEFTPLGTDLIPKLFDEYQKAGEAYFNKTDEDLARVFELSQIGGVRKPPSIRFSVLAQWVQMPNMEEQIKKEGLEEWAKYAKIWVEKYAPEKDKFLVQKELPEEVKNLLDKQKEFLVKISEELDKDWNAEDFQKRIYEISKELELSSKEAFSAIYTSLIGKDHGPKAGWLILSLDKDFVKKRFNETARINSGSHSGEEQSDDSRIDSGQARMTTIKSSIFSISSEIKNKFPSVSVGVAIIKGVEIRKSDDNLEKEKKELLSSLAGLTTEQISQYPEVISYRRLYRETGVDWHSRRPSPEALLRRIALKKGLYTVNTCVDAYNLIVMKHRVSVGAFDFGKIEFPTVLRFAKEGEEILLLGDNEPTKFKEGEIAYFDKEGGYNIDFNYRDAQRTAAQFESNNLYINVDGAYDITATMVEKSLKEACDLIIRYCGGKLELFGVETTT